MQYDYALFWGLEVQYWAHPLPLEITGVEPKVNIPALTPHLCTYILCTVTDLKKLTKFEWDQGNIYKSYIKHGISLNEAEEVFLDEDILLFEDFKHSQVEERSKAIGKIIKDEILLEVFTVRGNNIRIISARKANQQERRLYEQKS